MKSIFIAAIVALSTGCVSATEFETLRRENAALKDHDRRQRVAQSDGYRPPGAPALPSANPVPATAGNQMMGGQGSTGAMWTRQKHDVYMGTVGAQPRQVTQGRKIKLDNQVCDGGSRDMWSACGDADDNGAPDLNTWLAFEIDGQPVICDSGFYHPESQVSLLPPGQACHVEVGRSRKVKLTIKAYRNSGTASYVILDSTPSATSYRTVSVGDRNIAYYGVDETRF